MTSLKIQEDISLKPYNTFGLDVKAKWYVEVNDVEELRQVLREKKFTNVQKLILGGGSNVLFQNDFPGLVIHNKITGIEQVREDDTHVWLKAGSGEVWHELVLYCIENNLAGIENLSLIPGTVGAAPMQNIGAYGVELKEVFEELDAVRLKDGEIETFDAERCNFGYRESIFKKEAKGKYFISSVTLKLKKTPQINVSYGALQNVLQDKNAEELTIRDVSEAVCSVRRSKLPDPKILGNAGSFFKNPEIPEEQFKALQKKFTNIVGYPTVPGKVKVAAGWLIEHSGWKGKRVGETGSHKDQALVLVNFGAAKGEEIVQLSRQIQESVKEKFGIELQPEVNII